LASNIVYLNVSYESFKKVHGFIETLYEITPKLTPVGVRQSFEINPKEGKITFTYYASKKFMIQSSPSNSIFVSLSVLINDLIGFKPQGQIVSAPIDEQSLTSDFFIGCDESGKGESFGSMFLGCAIISRSELIKISPILKDKNIRNLSKGEIKELVNALDGQYQFVIKSYMANEIDSNSLNLLLDRGYIESISKLCNDIENLTIIIDDYGIRNEMREFVKSITTNEKKVIVKTKADEEFTACKVASLIARHSRYNEIETNDKLFSFDDVKGMKYYPGSGSASNPNTERYLIEYRKINPSKQFPSFVRTKWKNVIAIENQFPRKLTSLNVRCSHCDNSLRMVHVQYDRTTGTKLYCTYCSNLITPDEFRNYFINNVITVDTSAIISRIVSKDLKSTSYFRDNTFLLPTFVYEELDSKQPDTKKGGLKEIDELVEFANRTSIKFEKIDTHMLAPGLTNDKKILSVLDNSDSSLLTMDRTMSSFGKVNHLVFFVKIY
jgi:ribonuclease HIII